MAANRAARRKRLFEEDPVCSFCQVEMTLGEELKPHQSQPKNLAVLFSSVNRTDHTSVGMPVTVLCCLKCATEKNAEKNIALGIDELRARSSAQGMCDCPTCGYRHPRSIKYDQELKLEL